MEVTVACSVCRLRRWLSKRHEYAERYTSAPRERHATCHAAAASPGCRRETLFHAVSPRVDEVRRAVNGMAPAMELVHPLEARPMLPPRAHAARGTATTARRAGALFSFLPLSPRSSSSSISQEKAHADRKCVFPFDTPQARRPVLINAPHHLGEVVAGFFFQSSRINACCLLLPLLSFSLCRRQAESCATGRQQVYAMLYRQLLPPSCFPSPQQARLSLLPGHTSPALLLDTASSRAIDDSVVALFPLFCFPPSLGGGGGIGKMRARLARRRGQRGSASASATAHNDVMLADTGPRDEE